MKQLKFLVVFLLSILALGCQSCSKDNDDEPTKNDIVGTWAISEVSTNNGVSFSVWPMEPTCATFSPNGSYYGIGYFGNGSGTWKQKGNTIITYVDGEEYIRYEIKELTSSTCTLVMSMNGSNSTLWIRCTKTILT